MPANGYLSKRQNQNNNNIKVTITQKESELLLSDAKIRFFVQSIVVLLHIYFCCRYNILNVNVLFIIRV